MVPNDDLTINERVRNENYIFTMFPRQWFAKKIFKSNKYFKYIHYSKEKKG